MPPFTPLTPRERQVVDLLLEGCDNAEIAKQLKVARRTVKHMFHQIFMKYRISGESGIKRVKLAVLVYRERRAQEVADGRSNDANPANPAAG